MSPMSFDRHCAELITQASAFGSHLAGADLARPVPTCPGWNVAQLGRHVDGGLRWACEIVATRADSPPPDTALRDLSAVTADDPDRLAGALREAARELATALHDAGPDAQMWCPVAGGGARFYARRFAHETAIHRADAALGLGIDFELDSQVATDGVEEWLQLGAMPFHFEVHPWMRELLGPGRTIGLQASDTGDSWLLDFTGDAIDWQRGAVGAAATVTGPVSGLVLALYRRRPVSTLTISGDTALVDFWMERVAFG